MRIRDAVRHGLTKRGIKAGRLLPAAMVLLAPALTAQRATGIAIQQCTPSAPTYTTPSAPGAAAPLTLVTCTVFVEDIATETGVLSGTVTFYDTHPLDRTMYADPLGTVSILTPPASQYNGYATITVALGPGVHQISASYSGTSGTPTGTFSSPGPWEWASTTITSTQPYYQVTVGGQALTTTYLYPLAGSGTFQYGIGSDGVNDEYTYTAPAVLGNIYGYGMQYPSGSAKVTDQTVPTTYAPVTGPGEEYSSLGQVIVMDAPAPGVTSFILADPFLAGVPTIVAFYSGLNAVYTIDINRAQAGGSAASAIGCTPCTVAPSPVQGVAVDLNEDGLQDLVIAHNDASGVGVMQNKLNPSLTSAQQTFGAETTYSLGGRPVKKVVTGDFNGDGWPDIIALMNDGSNQFTVLLNNRNGTFTPTGNFYTAGSGAVDIGVGAFYNMDAYHSYSFNDVVVLNQADVTVSLFHGNGDGTFQAPTAIQAAPSFASAIPKALTVADLDKDGYPDVAVVSDYSSSGPGFTYGGVSFLYGSSSAPLTYTPATHDRGIFASAIGNTAIVATDLDGDGFPDLLFSATSGANFAPVMYQEVGNPFSAQQASYPTMDGYDGFPGPVGYAGTGNITPANAQPTFSSVGVATGDVNGDGLQDVVLMSPSNPNYPATPQKESIVIGLTTLGSAFVTQNMIATPTGPHTVTEAYTPGPGNYVGAPFGEAPPSIYAPAISGPFTGTLAVPIATLNPASELDFGAVSVGTETFEQVTLSNFGSAPLVVSSIAITNSLGNVYNELDSCGTQPFTLAAGLTCTINVGFAPVAAGANYNGGTLTVTDNTQNVAGSTQTITLNGSAVTGTGVTMTLTSSNYTPNYVTPASGGLATPLNPVTLTATVLTTTGGAPVVGGTVTFYDNPGMAGAVAPDVIGTSAVQYGASAFVPGTATLVYAFGPGPHTLTATYSGTATYAAASAAAPNPPLVSTGSAAEAFKFVVYGVGDLMGIDTSVPYGSPIYINQSGDPTSANGNVFGYGMEVPTGTISVNDATTGTSYPLSEGSYNETYAYTPFYTYPLSGNGFGDFQRNFSDTLVTSFITADLFQNGVPAVINVSTSNNQLYFHLLYGTQPNSGDFQLSVNPVPTQVVAADVNGDGIPDLVVAHNDPSGSSSIGVLFNTFNPASPTGPQFLDGETVYKLANPISNIAVGDVNGDGFNDIVAVTGDGSNLIYVLQNSSNGTFTATGTTYAAGNGASQVALGDFNKDGKLDIAVLNTTDATMGILLGNGNGTFQAMVPYSVGTAPTAFAMADLNVDGNIDFAITNNDSTTSAEVSFLYGNGDGTFTYTANATQNAILPLSANWPETNWAPTSIQAIDMNGDGCPDLMIGFNVNATMMAICNPTINQYTYFYNYSYDNTNGENLRTVSMAGADLNGDGLVDFLLMTTVNNDLPSNPNQNGVMVQLTGAMAPGYGGPMVVDSPVGNHDFNETYTPTANSIYTAGSLGPMTFNIQSLSGTLSNCDINFGYVVPNTHSAPVTCTLTNTGQGTLQPGQISVPGNDASIFGIQSDLCSYSTLAAGATCTFQVVFYPTAAVNYSASLIVPSNSTNGGLGAQSTLIGTGIAPMYTTTTTLTGPSGAAKACSQVTLTAQVTATSGIPAGTVNFYNNVAGSSALIGTGTLSNGTATFTTSYGAGPLFLTAAYQGNGTFSGSTSSTLTLPVSLNTLTVTAGNNSRNFEGANPSFNYGYSGFINGDTTSVITGHPDITTTATLNSVGGTYPINISQGTLSNSPYNCYGFSFVPGTLTINGGFAQTITFLVMPIDVPGRIQILTLDGRSTSGLTVTYGVTGPANLIGANGVAITGPGTVTITAYQNGNSTFAPATPVVRTFTVTP